MSFAASPNLVDFTTYVGNQGVPAAALPVDSPYLQYALDWAENRALHDPTGHVPGMEYVFACYNAGLHFLLREAPDQIGQNFFTNARQQYGLSSFVAGPVLSSSDSGTSQSLAGSNGVRDLPLSAMDLIKTPWGAAFLAYQQSFGPNLMGLT